MKTNINFYYSALTSPQEVYELKNFMRRMKVSYNEMRYDAQGSVTAINSLQTVHYKQLVDEGISLPQPFDYCVITWSEFPVGGIKIAVGKEKILEVLSVA